MFSVCNRQDSDDDRIHMGHAIMTFYSALIDLLGRCAPETHVSVFQTKKPNIFFVDICSVYLSWWF